MMMAMSLYLNWLVTARHPTLTNANKSHIIRSIYQKHKRGFTANLPFLPRRGNWAPLFVPLEAEVIKPPLDCQITDLRMDIMAILSPVTKH